MSGHSKWSTIKHKKAARDHARGNVFTKMANNIAIAVKRGGGVGDPEFNFSLRLAIEKARSVNMPMDNIKRAVERGLGKGDGGQLSEVLIEGFGPGGFGVLVEAVTDNTNRTIGDVRLVMEKNGGVMGVMGSVSYMFTKTVAIEYEGELNESLQLELIDAGMSEFEEDGGKGVLYTPTEGAKRISEVLGERGIKVIDVSTMYLPKVTSQVEHDVAEEYVEKISALDDVVEVFSNAI